MLWPTILAEKLEVQKANRDLEGERDKTRRELFTRPDEIQGQRDKLIGALEAQLRQRLETQSVLACEWGMQ
jgi:hypothetical protein